MQMEPDGSVIYYQDVAINKKPAYVAGAEQWRDAARLVLQESDIWISYEKLEPQGPFVMNACKLETVRRIARSQEVLDLILNRRLLVCCRILVRNTPAMRALFWDEILPLFADDSLLVPETNETLKHPKLRWETGDQAIWNAFLYNLQYSGRLPPSWPLWQAGKGPFTLDNLKMYDSDCVGCR